MASSLTNIKQSTGYEEELVQEMFQKYGVPCGILWMHYIQALAFVHLYPMHRQVCSRERKSLVWYNELIFAYMCMCVCLLRATWCLGVHQQLLLRQFCQP